MVCFPSPGRYPLQDMRPRVRFRGSVEGQSGEEKENFNIKPATRGQKSRVDLYILRPLNSHLVSHCKCLSLDLTRNKVHRPTHFKFLIFFCPRSRVDTRDTAVIAIIECIFQLCSHVTKRCVCVYQSMLFCRTLRNVTVTWHSRTSCQVFTTSWWVPWTRINPHQIQELSWTHFTSRSVLDKVNQILSLPIQLLSSNRPVSIDRLQLFAPDKSKRDEWTKMTKRYEMRWQWTMGWNGADL